MNDKNAAAAVLRVWQAWTPEVVEPGDSPGALMRDVGEALVSRGYALRDTEGDALTVSPSVLTPDGRDLLGSCTDVDWRTQALTLHDVRWRQIDDLDAMQSLLTSAVRDLEKGLAPGREWLAAAKKLLG